MASSSNTGVTFTSSKDILSSIPLGICALGQVMLTASVDDKSINNPPIGGYKHITYPDSLRVTLMQISKMGDEALFSGHLGMDVINYYSQEIETTCTEAERNMRKATTENQAFIGNILRSKLRCMERTTKISQNESEKVVKALEKLLDLVKETSNACFDSKTVQERRLEENQKKENELQEKKKAADNEKLKQEKVRDEYEEQLKNNREEFYSAHKAFSVEVPKGWALFRAEAFNMIREIFHIEYENNFRLIFARLKIVRETQKKIEEKIEQAKEQTKALDREIDDVDIQLIRLDLKKVTYDDALKMLQEAVKFITCLLTHWRKLQDFFQALNNSVQQHLGRKLDPLTLSQSDHSIISDDILRLLKSMGTQSYQIGCLGDLCAKISSLYIMPGIKGIRRCIAVDPERIEQVSKELTVDAKRAHESIVKAIEKDDELDLLSTDKGGKIRIYEILAISDADCM